MEQLGKVTLERHLNATEGHQPQTRCSLQASAAHRIAQHTSSVSSPAPDEREPDEAQVTPCCWHVCSSLLGVKGQLTNETCTPDPTAKDHGSGQRLCYDNVIDRFDSFWPVGLLVPGSGYLWLSEVLSFDLES